MKYVNAYIQTIRQISNTFVKFTTFIAVALMAACSDSGSGSSVGGSNDGPVREAFSISVDEKDSIITLHLKVPDENCILRNSSVSWVEELVDYDHDIRYHMSSPFFSLELGDLSFPLFKGDTNKTVYGIRNPITGYYYDKTGEISQDTVDYSSTLEITRDSLIITTENPYFLEEKPEENPQEPEELSINLLRSRFMLDFYQCATGKYICSLLYQNLVKSAASLTIDMEKQENITVRERKDTSVQVTLYGRDYTITAEHVQMESINYGNKYISVTIKSGEKSCHYEYIKKAISKELCKDENLQYLRGAVIQSDEGQDTLISEFFKNNYNEFNDCVYALTR